MFSEPAHVSDFSSVTQNAFYIQLRRLESLQLLMAQGSSVVNEVIEFMAKARAEIDVLRRDQEAATRGQEVTASENLLLQSQVTNLEQSLESAQVRAKEQELLTNQLRQEITQNSAAISIEDLERERERHRSALRDCDQAAEAKDLLLHQNASLRREIEQQSDEEVKRRSEIGALQIRIGALEKQLAGERERRVRLMDVLKIHEVKIAGRITLPEPV